MKDTILAINGKPGLYKLVSRGNNSLIVETLDDAHRRMPVFASDRITSLRDTAMYTDDEDKPLVEILDALYKKEEGKESSLNYKKASSKQLREYFAEILPDFDRERVHDSDIKKLLQWYNILVKNGVTDFLEQETEESEGAEN
ncbi:MAG: DUF5606 domain-containing protein [Bacteroidaceae bacterium]|nr:DUF5606 domain-containing protein [Bacteroidaceae bacterium]